LTPQANRRKLNQAIADNLQGVDLVSKGTQAKNLTEEGENRENNLSSSRVNRLLVRQNSHMIQCEIPGF
jgi:hypothetical protein